MVEIKEGESLEVKIEFAGKKGDGIVKKDDFVIFVPNTKEGDSVKVKINKILNKVAFAEIEK